MTSLEEASAILQQNPGLRAELRAVLMQPAFKAGRKFAEAYIAGEISKLGAATNPTIMNNNAFIQQGVSKAFELLELATRDRRPPEPDPEHFAHYGEQSPDTQQT